MEERAWERRLEEGRAARLEQDPTLTELDLRRQEAALEWSAYGNSNSNTQQEEQQQQREVEERRGRGRRRVMVTDRDDDDIDSNDNDDEYKMTDDEIDQFKMEYGVDYDPYYDDPYTEEQLPADVPYQVDAWYGDRVYENGEIFYKDAASGYYYRQGAKPRSGGPPLWGSSAGKK